VTTQRAFTWQGGTRCGVESVPLPRPAAGWVAIDVAYAGICGSDLHICAGQHPRARPGVVLGHEFVGVLAEPTETLPRGTPVFADPMVHCGACDACLRGISNVCDRLTAVGVDYPGALTSRVAVPVDNVYPLPEGAELRTLALTEPVAVGVRAIRRGQLKSADRVHVVGAGPIGVILALLARRAGATSVTLSEPAVERRRAARDLGLDVVAGGAGSATADVVFDATGHPSASPALATWVRAQGRIVIVGAFPPGAQGIDLLRVNFAELTVIGSRIYSREDIEAAIALLPADADLPALITAVRPLDQAPRALDDLRQGRAMKVLIDPTASS
jgi:(R,R)-butanediol dehydrogenase/meso-butanediol dehydrogenase/diacetyl reductase